MTAYTREEVIEFIKMEDVKFIRLAFCDFFGNLRNIAIVPDELEKAFDEGIAFDGSAIEGFADEAHSDLFLVPIPSTFAVLPWRSVNGKVVRMFCKIFTPDGNPFVRDCRYILSQAVELARSMNLKIHIGTDCEFYLFKTDEKGEPTKIPFDNARYFAVSPEDKGENIRREITLILKEMDIQPESSHHEEGLGQNEIDFKYAEPIKAADNFMNFVNVVKAVAVRNGLVADFSPKPLETECGNGLHINISINQIEESNKENKDLQEKFMAGVLFHIKEITAFLNSTENSYKRLGQKKAPKYIGWGHSNRTQLIRVPAIKNGQFRFELRSPDPLTNPYLSFALIIFAGLEGIKNNIPLVPAIDENLFNASSEITSKLEKLPHSLQEARDIAKNSEFIKTILKNVESYFN